jgi:putative DNA primase/helicase
MYHWGSGANGKSVFLAVIAGVLGSSLSVSLPKETIMGQGERGAGQASPDLVRLLGKRMVRIDELKDGEALREDLIKRLTGGDPMTVRAMYEAYLEFPNVATPHMSGNGKPKIDGTDNGIWRRMLVMHWSVEIPEGRRRDFDEIVADLLTERDGILNWLIAGAVDYLENGLYIAPAARAATEEYRVDMDPVRQFRERCLKAVPGARVQASRMYAAYVAWAKANGRTEFSATRVGKELGRSLRRDETGSVRFYVDVELTPEAAGLVDGVPPPASYEREDYA